MFDDWRDGRLQDRLWREYASLDVYAFHMLQRSLFDNVQLAAKAIPSDLPRSASFEDMQNKVINDPKFASALGSRLCATVRERHVFKPLREIRNQLIHYGADASVFYVANRYCFQVYRKADSLITFGLSRDNANVADFRIYAGAVYGYLLGFLESFARIAFSELEIEHPNPSFELDCLGRCTYSGFGMQTAKRWAELALDQLDQEQMTA
jgi:hypothetical protein